MTISNLLQPNPTVPGLLSSLAPKKAVPTYPAGPQSLLPTSVPTSGTASKPVVSTATSGAGAYKGVPLTGTDQQIADQMRQIDNPTQTNSAITGNTTTPSGAIVNATTGATISSPQNQPTKGLFSSVVGSLANKGAEVNPMTQQSYDKAQEYQRQLTQSKLDEAQALQNQGGPIPIGDITGRQGLVANYYGQRQGALATALQGESSLAGIGNSVQGQQIGALSSAAGLASPRSADLLVDPVTGQPIGDIKNMGSALANWSSIRAGANTAGQFTGDYQTGLATLRAADTIGQQIISTLQSNPTLNTQPLSAITNIKAFLAGQASDPAQQLLSQQIANYISALGIDPNTINLAGQEQKTLGQLLDSLRESVAGQVESKNPQNVINNPQGTNPTTPTGGQVINTSVGPIDNAWF